MTTFQRKIRDLADKSDLIVSDIGSEVATLVVDIDGDFRSIYVTNYDGVWEFAGYTMLSADDAEDFPKQLLAILLRQNSTAKRGFWSIATVADRTVICYMHNIPASLLTAEEFREICGTVAQQAEMLNEAVRRTEVPRFPHQTDD